MFLEELQALPVVGESAIPRLGPAAWLSAWWSPFGPQLAHHLEGVQNEGTVRLASLAGVQLRGVRERRHRFREAGGGLRDPPVLIVYIWGDNGASMEGTVTGSFNEMTFLNGVVLDPEQQLKLIDERYGGIDAIGGEHTAPHVAAAWAHAGNTPFQWGKQMASHLGGTRNPMVVAWPDRLKPDTEMRTQFTHCIDIAPTVLEAAGIPEPTHVDGIEQEPMDGTSFLYTLDDAKAEEQHTVQYFEFAGSRAIYHDGWWACAKLDRSPGTSHPPR